MPKSNPVATIICLSGYYGDNEHLAIESGRRGIRENKARYIILDLLAELTMPALAKGRVPYAASAIRILKALLPDIVKYGVKVISNFGGLDPSQAAAALLTAAAPEHRTKMRIAVVTGDDRFDQTKAATGAPVYFESRYPWNAVQTHLATANVYIGAEPLTTALRSDANFVVCGRCCDASMAVAAAAYHHGWSFDDYDRLAGATAAGHIIECGGQATGGNLAVPNWSPALVPNSAFLGYPIAEIAADGRSVITLPEGMGGSVTPTAVMSQVLYEIGDFAQYPTADVVTDLSELSVRSVGDNRVAVSGAKGSRPSAYYKLGLTHLAGVRVSAEAHFIGETAFAAARKVGEDLPERLKRERIEFDELHRSVIGSPASSTDLSAHGIAPGFVTSAAIRFAGLRDLSDGDSDGEATERSVRGAISALSSMVLNHPPGQVSYATGSSSRVMAWASGYVWADSVKLQLELLWKGEPATAIELRERRGCRGPITLVDGSIPETTSFTCVDEGQSWNFVPLSQLVACARSGDKGRHANVGFWARGSEEFELLRRWFTPAVALGFYRTLHHGFEPLPVEACSRFLAPKLNALNFLLLGALGRGGGGTNVHLDSQGKGLALAALSLLRIPIPASVSIPR